METPALITTSTGEVFSVFSSLFFLVSKDWLLFWLGVVSCWAWFYIYVFILEAGFWLDVFFFLFSTFLCLVVLINQLALIKGLFYICK